MDCGEIRVGDAEATALLQRSRKEVDRRRQVGGYDSDAAFSKSLQASAAPGTQAIPENIRIVVSMGKHEDISSIHAFPESPRTFQMAVRPPSTASFAP